MRHRLLNDRALLVGLIIAVVGFLSPMASGQDPNSPEDPPPLGTSCPVEGPYSIPAAGASMTVRYHVHLLQNDDGGGGIPLTRVTALLNRMVADLATVQVNLVESGRTFIRNINANYQPSSARAISFLDNTMNIYLGAGQATGTPPRGTSSGDSFTIPSPALYL